MKYEYRVEFVRGPAQTPLNNLGEDGWELVHVVQRGATGVCYLKREKPLIEKFGKTFSERTTTVEEMETPKSRGGRPKGSKNKPKP